MALEGMLSGLDIATSGLAAERKHMAVVTQNIAMAGVVRTVDPATGALVNKPYVRRTLLFREALERAGEEGLHGVEVGEPVLDERGEFPRVHDPSNIAADEQGFVTRSNVNLVYEMLDLVISRHSYEANLAAFRTWQEIARKSIDLMRA